MTDVTATGNRADTGPLHQLTEEEASGWATDADVRDYITRRIEGNGDAKASDYNLDAIARDAFVLTRGVFRLAVFEKEFWEIVRRNELAPALTEAGEQAATEAADEPDGTEDANATAMSIVKELVAMLAQMSAEDLREFSAYRAGFFDAARHIVAGAMGWTHELAGEWLAGQLMEAIDMGKSRRVSG
jgi:hypothetical protein